ncbi:MAG: hypothetical protein ACREKE_07355, partial [bacterium]
MPDPGHFGKLEALLVRITDSMARRIPYASALAIRREGMRATVSSTQSGLSPETPSIGVVFTAFNGESLFESSVNT